MLYNYFKFLLLCTLLVMNSGCLRFAKYKPVQNKGDLGEQSSVVTTHHEVKAGETLYSIAFEYGRDHRDVARWNRIQRPYTIYPNQKLRVVPVSSDRVTKKQYKLDSRSSTVRKSIPINNQIHHVANSEIIWNWPTQGKVTRTFLIRDPGRRGIDIVGRKGQAVKAAAAGRVVYRGSGLRGFGNLIILKHNETYFSAYAHTENVVVKENEKIKLGQKLADMSSTNTDKTKLHFEIRRNGKPVNPLRYLPKRR